MFVFVFRISTITVGARFGFHWQVSSNATSHTPNRATSRNLAVIIYV